MGAERPYLDIHNCRGSLLGCMDSGFIQIFSAVLRQPSVSHSSFEALDVSILLGLTRLNVLEGNTCLVNQILNGTTNFLRTNVTTNNQRSTLPLNDLLKGSDEPLRR
jgi:hypothetical protein